MDTSALAATMVSMNAALTGAQFSVAMVKQAHETQQMAVNLLAQVAETGKAALPAGVGAALDRSA